MEDTESKKAQTLSGTGRSTGLRRPIEKETVRQSFSHGRSKAVVVEKKRRRIIRSGQDSAISAESVPEEVVPVAPVIKRPLRVKREVKSVPGGADSSAGVVLRSLTTQEKDARAHALAAATAREHEERKIAASEAEERRRRDELRAKEQAESEARASEEAARRTLEENARVASESKAAERESEDHSPAAVGREGSEAETPATNGMAPVEGRKVLAAEKGSEKEASSRTPRGAKTAQSRVGKNKPGRRQGRISVTNAFEQRDERFRSIAAFRRRVEREKRRARGDANAAERKKISREVTIPETITIQELASRMAEQSADVIRLLMRQGAMHKPGDVIDGDTAQLLAEELGHTAKRYAESDVLEGLFGEEDDGSSLEPRPPVVTIMGHVDHGKTTLLDVIRNSRVARGEAGGITQHIGAYQVVTSGGSRITFLDTPGHEAFSAIRVRGAQSTDIVVLVVAADDSVMPQTIEAIRHTQAAKVPMIVAINKMDRPDANPDKVRNMLMQYGVISEKSGGEVQDVEISALKGENVDALLDAIELQAEILELKANSNRPADGVVIEARKDPGRGTVIAALVQRGTLAVGDIVVAGTAWGRVRILADDRGETVATVGPGDPVEVLGLSGAPEAGDRFAVVDSETRAREVVDYRANKEREKRLAGISGPSVDLEALMSSLAGGDQEKSKEMSVVIRADVYGSLEAIRGAIASFANDEVSVNIVHDGIGAVTEADVTLAVTSKSSILAFNVRPTPSARAAARSKGVDIRIFGIIYELIDDVRKRLSGLLAPKITETVLGTARVQEVFNISKVGNIAGCIVEEGVIEDKQPVRLIRDGVVLHSGKLDALKRFKDKVSQVRSGQECGLALANFQDIRGGDTIESYHTASEARSL